MIPRRLEVPVLSDVRGHAWAAGALDITLRHQGRRVLAESPPPGLPEERVRLLLAASVEMVRARGEAGAFTVTYEADPESGEMRLQGSAPGLPAEHAVLEALTGVDLPAWQARLARGGSLDSNLPEPRGHALQAALSARDPEEGFVPSPGPLRVLRLPCGAGLRADSSLEEGMEPDPEDPVLVRLTAHGRTRAEALLRLQQALAKTVAVVEGGGTDKAFLAELLDQSEIERGTAEPGWLDLLIERGEHLSRRGAEAALLAAAIAVYEREAEAALRRFYDSAARGRPEVPPDLGTSAGLWYRGQAYALRVARLEPRLFRIEVDGCRLEVRTDGRRLAIEGRSWHVSISFQGDGFLVEVDGVPYRVARDPGKAGASGERIRFDQLAPRRLIQTDEAERRRQGLEEVRRLMLGYDVDPGDTRRAAGGLPDPGTWRLEEEILRTYVDLGLLFRRRAEGQGRHSTEEYLFTYLRDLDDRGAGLPPEFLDRLRRGLAHYGVAGLDRTPALEESLFRIGISHGRQAQQAAPVLTLLDRLLERGSGSEELRDLLDRLIEESQGREPALHDLAREVRYRLFDRSLLLAAQERILAEAREDLAALEAGLSPTERAERIHALVESPQLLQTLLSERFVTASPALQDAILEALIRRYYRVRDLTGLKVADSRLTADYEHARARVRLLAIHARGSEILPALDEVERLASEIPRDDRDERELAVDLHLWRPGELREEETAAEIAARLARPGFPPGLRRVAVCIARHEGVRCFTFRATEDGYAEDELTRGLHPMIAQRLELWRLKAFRLERLVAPDGVLLFRGVAHENPGDERLFAIAEVRDLTPVRDASGRVTELPQLERMLMEALAGIRRFQSRRASHERLHWNRVLLYLWPVVDLRPREITGLVHRLAPRTEGLGLEKVVIRSRTPDWVLEISNPGSGTVLRFRRPSETPLKPLREYSQKVVELRKRGLVHPFDIVRMLGDFVEHDLDEEGRLVPVGRPPGQNTAGIVAGVVRNVTDRYPEGMTRVLLLGDPGRDMGALAEPECRRILAAIDLARSLGVPLEWFPFSNGPRIAMDSGTESLDWAALVLRRLVELTQAGGEVNLVVAGLNAGVQPFWNAAATMLMHTRGILVMTPDGTMVLSGKQALDHSGSVSAEDNQGIGGYERIMGPNGQAQYLARDLPDACRLLLRWYEHTWKAPGERFPRQAETRDPRDRDIRDFPHGNEFRTVGEVFSEETNPGREKPFDIRKVMSAAVDQDHEPLERWYGMRDAEIGVVWDAHLGGHPVCLIGFESHSLPRLGFVPVYGPEQWTGGTLFPFAAKKIARAINSASGNRPLVVLANLTGFDGSPESMRRFQLEFGTEIGRAVVNFRGPIVFCVISRYHGGAFVVFSHALNDNMEVAALEGSQASVIGGAPAAAVVFAREVDRRTRRDPRIAELEREIADPDRTDKAALRARLEEMLETVRSEKLGEVAEELDGIHSLERALRVGSLHRILPAAELRPYLIDAVERGMARS